MSHRFAMTRRDLATVERAVRDAHHMLSRDPGYSDAKPLHAPSKMHVKGALTQTAEVFSSSLVFGALQGRFGAWGLGPVPGNVISGLVMHGLAMFGLGGPDYAHHLHNLGDGALASYSTTLGTQLGNMWRLKSGGSPFSGSGHGGQYGGGAWDSGSTTAGAMGSGRRTLSDAEMQSLMSAVR